MRFWIGMVALFLAAPGFARSYHLVLDPPAGGRLLKGYGGLQASDQRTATATAVSRSSKSKRRSCSRIDSLMRAASG